MGYRKKITFFIKASSFVCAILCYCPAVVTAQVKTKDSGKESESPAIAKAREETEWMQENLYLSDGQYDKVTAINMSFAHNTDSLARIQDVRARQAAVENCRKKKDNDLKCVLNSKQYKTYISSRGKKQVAKKSPFSGTY